MTETLHYLPDPRTARTMDTEALRAHFLVTDLFRDGEIVLRAYDVDRVVLGGAVPVAAALALAPPPILGSEYFAERREIGVLNVGGAGTVTVDSREYQLQARDGLYIGRGTRHVTFASTDAARPARFYIVSYPAHAAYPTVHVTRSAVQPIELGETRTANRRWLFKYFHPESMRTAQLVMGVTELQEGNVWNTMPPHTHQRRSEVYFYFDVPADGAVVHLMGEPQQIRNLLVHNEQVVLSPPWSVHAGCGTSSYSFCWAMGGENQDYTDMQGAPISELR